MAKKNSESLWALTLLSLMGMSFQASAGCDQAWYLDTKYNKWHSDRCQFDVTASFVKASVINGENIALSVDGDDDNIYSTYSGESYSTQDIDGNADICLRSTGSNSSSYVKIVLKYDGTAIGKIKYTVGGSDSITDDFGPTITYDGIDYVTSLSDNGDAIELLCTAQ